VSKTGGNVFGAPAAGFDGVDETVHLRVVSIGGGRGGRQAAQLAGSLGRGGERFAARSGFEPAEASAMEMPEFGRPVFKGVGSLLEPATFERFGQSVVDRGGFLVDARQVVLQTEAVATDLPGQAGAFVELPVGLEAGCPLQRQLVGQLLMALRELRRRAARWAADHLATLRAADPAMPGELDDRAADNWRPLLAIADLAGGEWPESARRAALALSGSGSEPPDSAREQLLADIRESFDERGPGRLLTEDLLQDLRAREDRPWGEWRGGYPLSAVQLARLLQPFGVRPRLFRTGGRKAPSVTPPARFSPW
jgi:hypothetical protein